MTNKPLLFFALLLLNTTAKAQDNIIINEIMASNVDYVIDPSFNYGSWIEIINGGSQAIEASKLYVTDDPADLKKSPVYAPRTTIAPSAFYTIWFDHHDDIWSRSQMNFKLDYDGGTIYVTDGEKILASQVYPQAIGRVSYARTEDGKDTWAWTANPTPGSSNNASTFVSSADKQLSAPEFSVDGCVFTDAFSVKITSADGADIYYTLSTDYKYDGDDGWGWNQTNINYSSPTPTQYEGKQMTSGEAIEIGKKSVVIRARAYKDGYLPSEVTTRSYIYKDKDYVFPIISIATDRDNLDGDEYGIMQSYGYGNGRPGNGQRYSCNWNADWDRPVNFEYITADGEYALNQEVDMAMCGGWSRAMTPHSFKLKAGKYYMGKNSLDYQFFDSKPYLKHKVLQIRNGGNDTQCRIKDAAIQEVVRRSGLRVNTQAWQPVHVFINGEYYDVLNMREPNNKHFAYSNYGYDTDEIDQFEISPDSCYVQKEGTDEKFLEWYDLSFDSANPETMAKIAEMVDIEEYINYMAVEFYCCTEDWARNNVKAFRHRDDGKFHFVLFDLDSQFGLSNPFTTFASRKNYTFDTLYGKEDYDYEAGEYTWITPWKTGDKITCENKFVTTFLNMLDNDEFRRRFVDSFCIVSGSVFAPARVKEIVTEMRDYMNLGMALKGGSSTNSAGSVISKCSSTHQSNMIDYLKAFIKSRGYENLSSFTVNLKSDIDEGEIFINGIKVPTGTVSGKMFKPLTLRATAPAGYRFVGWYKNIGGALISAEPEFEITENSARYTARWEPMTDEDMIAEGLNPAPVVINEVSASNDIYVSDYVKKSDWIELYNPTDADVNLAGTYLTDNISKPQKYQIPTDDVRLNTIIPAHGYKVIWCDKRENIGSDIHTSFKLEADSSYVALHRYEDDNLLYADTVKYEYHDGTHSYGRYPDGGANGYLMPKPTPGAANQCGTDVIDFLASKPVVTDIDEVRITADTDIAIAYVGQGIVNVKCETAPLARIVVYSSSASIVHDERADANFATVNLSTLPQGIYIIKATDINGNTASLKFKR